MKKTMLALLCAGATAFTSQAQESQSGNWTFKNVGGINLAQTSLTNWAPGGENSVAWNVYFNGSANYKKDKWSWDNALVTDFGKTYTSSSKWQKSLDKINLNSKVGYALSNHWNASLLGDLLTQFAPGYHKPGDKNPISAFMAPGYLTMALGADYKPNKHFSLLLSPVTGKMTFVLDETLSKAGAYGVKPGEKLFAELGTLIVANYNQDIMKNVNLISKLTLFSAYNHNYGNIDVNWDTMISFKINKFMSANLSTSLVYDDDIKSVDANGNVAGPKVQLRQVLGVGLTYSL